MQVKHQFVSGIPDDPNAAAAGEVLPSHWNADHQVTLTGADISGALGYTPYDAANPAGYVNQAGARAALSAVSPVTYNPATGQIGFVGTANAFSLNRLENGDFQVFQRNGGAPVTGFTGSAFHLDRWNDVSTNAVLSISRDSEALPNTWRHYRRQITTPYDPATNTINQCYVQQGIETQTLSDSGWGTAGAQQITISFEVRSSVTGNHAIALRNNTPGGPKVYVTTYSVPVANVFTPVSVTIPGDQAAAIGGTQNFLGLSLTFCHGAGSVYTTPTTDTWLAGEFMYTPGAVAVCNVLNATWDIRKVKIELGSSTTAFEIKNVSESVAICRRMYEQGTVISRWGNGANIPVTLTINYKTIKRASPTLQITMTNGTLGTVTSLNTDSASITGTSNGSGQFDFSWAALTEI
jgi:hypothetical protein